MRGQFISSGRVEDEEEFLEELPLSFRKGKRNAGEIIDEWSSYEDWSKRQRATNFISLEPYGEDFEEETITWLDREGGKLFARKYDKDGLIYMMLSNPQARDDLINGRQPTLRDPATRKPIPSKVVQALVPLALEQVPTAEIPLGRFPIRSLVRWNNELENDPDSVVEFRETARNLTKPQKIELANSATMYNLQNVVGVLFDEMKVHPEPTYVGMAIRNGYLEVVQMLF